MAYKDLSLKDRATVIKIAVANGITTLPEIKEAYNKFNEGGHLLQTGGSTKSSSNIEFSLLDPESWKYKGSPIYEENIPFAQAFSDAVYNDNDYFKWGNSMYNTDIDWNRKFSNTSNGTKPFQEFAEIMYPAVIRVLKENNYPLSMAPNIVRQAALESSYGTDARGSRGYNLSGIKWTPNSGDYKHSTGADGKEYIDFNDLHDYLNYKVQLLNNKYDALNAENTVDFVNRLHPKQSKTKVYSDSYTGDYSGNYKSYINNLNRLKSLDKYLLPLVKANGGHLFETGGKEFSNLLPELTVEAKYPYSNRVWSTADSSNADFVRRLLTNDKQSIPTWDNAGSYSTHKMASQDNIAFPMVQRNNGTLTDYSHPMWLNPNTGFVTALKNNDYIEFKTPGDARYYAEHYKQHYPEFFRGFKEGGHLFEGTTEPSQQMEVQLPELIVTPSAQDKADLQRFHDVFRKKDRQPVLNFLAAYNPEENTSYNEALNKIMDLHELGGKPKIKEDKQRPHYMPGFLGITTPTLHIDGIQDYLAEISHAINYNNGIHSFFYGTPEKETGFSGPDHSTLPPQYINNPNMVPPKMQGTITRFTDAYSTPNYGEYETHSVVEPLLWNYFDVTYPNAEKNTSISKDNILEVLKEAISTSREKNEHPYLKDPELWEWLEKEGVSPEVRKYLQSKYHSTGGPLYPFSFSKQGIPEVRY